MFPKARFRLTKGRLRDDVGSGLQSLINGVSIVPSYLAPQPLVPGLDQVNLLLPATLAGSGCSNVTLINYAAIQSNTVYVCFK